MKEKNTFGPAKLFQSTGSIESRPLKITCRKLKKK